jgi:hypothetical protein
MFFIRPFTDPVIVLSTCLCCHCLFVVFLSGSKSVCFLYVHSPTLLLYCLHVYVAIVYLWSFLSGSKSVCFLYDHSQYNNRVSEWTYKKHTDLLPLKKTTNKQWQHKHVDSTITGSVNGRIKNIQFICGLFWVAVNLYVFYTTIH